MRKREAVKRTGRTTIQHKPPLADENVLMVDRQAHKNNLAIGATSVLLLWINCTRLPRALRPRWYHRLGMVLCGVFYLGLAALVFVAKVLPEIKTLLGAGP